MDWDNLGAPYLSMPYIQDCPKGMPQTPRIFPASWRAKKLPVDGYKMVDANGQALVYGRDNRRDAGATKALTPGDARRILR